MRILVHGLASYTKGGIETFVLGMAEHMTDNLIFDYVIEKDEAGKAVQLPGNGDTLMIEPKRRMFANLRSWSKLLKERKNTDSAVYFNWYSMAWLFPAMMARTKGYKVFIHAHNNNLHNCGLLQRFMHSVNRQFQKCMHIIRLTNSELSARFFFGNKKAQIIHNAIDTERFRFNDSVRSKIRGEYSIEDKHVYGFAGRLAYQKNPLFLIDIFNEIRKIDENAAFLVCGDGDLMDEVKERANKYDLDVLFTGAVSNIQDYYNAMDVFILPSRFEGLGIVLIEAQCNGLHCIASSNVIPKDSKVTDLVRFESLDNDASIWGKYAADLAMKNVNRAAYSDQISKTRYNILTESVLLEKILISSVAEDRAL